MKTQTVEKPKEVSSISGKSSAESNEEYDERAETSIQDIFYNEWGQKYTVGPWTFHKTS